VVRGGAQPAAGEAAEVPAPLVATLTNSLHRRNDPLTMRVYPQFRGAEEPDMRLIVALTAALTVLILVLPAHP
jgi:hypothetical protein